LALTRHPSSAAIKKVLPCGKTEASQPGQATPYPYPIIDLAGLSVPKLKNLLFVCGLYGRRRQNARAFFRRAAFCEIVQKATDFSPRRAADYRKREGPRPPGEKGRRAGAGSGKIMKKHKIPY
jgi:hypothetical protein